MNSNKRERLTEAAKLMFYQQGVSRTTLADIAHQAQVPLGNVYYHFSTKEAIVEAVIQAHVQELQTWFAQLEDNPDPRQRLQGLLTGALGNMDALTRFGCPHGSLCQELDKEGGQVASTASRIFQTYLNWTQQQFRLLGKDEETAQDLALDLVTALQGTFLLSNSFHSPAILERKLQRLGNWLNTI